MKSPPALFDPNRLSLHRSRARTADPNAWFLHRLAQDLSKDRLSEINKPFTHPTIIGWRAQDWATALDLDAECVPDADILNLKEQSSDLIVHALSLHWANDPVGQLVQARRALRPDGMLLAILFGGQTLSELRVVLAEAETRIRGGISPHVSPMAEIRDLGGLLQRAGYALPVADSFLQTVSYADLKSLMLDLRHMGETNSLVNIDKRGLNRTLLDTASDIYAESFSDKDARIQASFEFMFLTGWAPHPDQQKPLRPGSADISLANAIGQNSPNKERN